LMSYSLFPVLKNMKIKKELEKQWNEIEWNGMRSIITFATNSTLICDIEANYCLNSAADMLSDWHLFTASRILECENLHITLNSDCESNNSYFQLRRIFDISVISFTVGRQSFNSHYHVITLSH
jgi:hypothetical protein